MELNMKYRYVYEDIVQLSEGFHKGLENPK